MRAYVHAFTCVCVCVCFKRSREIAWLVRGSLASMRTKFDPSNLYKPSIVLCTFKLMLKRWRQLSTTGEFQASGNPCLETHSRQLWGTASEVDLQPPHVCAHPYVCMSTHICIRANTSKSRYTLSKELNKMEFMNMITLNPICFLPISFKYVTKYLSLSYKGPLDMLGTVCFQLEHFLRAHILWGSHKGFWEHSRAHFIPLGTYGLRGSCIFRKVCPWETVLRNKGKEGTDLTLSEGSIHQMDLKSVGWTTWKDMGLNSQLCHVLPVFP